MRFIVHLREKKKGTVEVEATDSLDAINKVKRLVHMGRYDEGVMESSGIVITNTEEIIT